STMTAKTINFMIHARAASTDQSAASGELARCAEASLPASFCSASLRSPCWSPACFFSWPLPCSSCFRPSLPPFCCPRWSGGRPPPLSPGCLPCPLPLSPSCLPCPLPLSPDCCPWLLGLSPPCWPELL